LERSDGPTVGNSCRDGRGGRLLRQGRKKGAADEGGEEEGATVKGEGTAEEEVAAAARATVGEVGDDHEGRKVRIRMRLRLWLRRKEDVTSQFTQVNLLAIAIAMKRCLSPCPVAGNPCSLPGYKHGGRDRYRCRRRQGKRRRRRDLAPRKSSASPSPAPSLPFALALRAPDRDPTQPHGYATPLVRVGSNTAHHQMRINSKQPSISSRPNTIRLTCVPRPSVDKTGQLGAWPCCVRVSISLVFVF
ncbi:hypothetical protein BHE74_00026057, partial [Ensete ventricosum]